MPPEEFPDSEKFILQPGDFEDYADVDDARASIRFARLPDGEVAVIGDLDLYGLNHNTAVEAIMPYEEYLKFYNSITIETPSTVIMAKLREYITPKTEVES